MGGRHPDAQPAAQSEHQPKGTHEGIKVHGHWTIEVRDPDGTVRSHTEFENSLVQANGGVSLQNLLSGQASTGGWEIALGPPPGQQFLGETPCYNSITYSPCSIVSPAVAYSGCSTDPSCFPNLIVSPSSYQLSPAPSTPMVILQGTATAGSGGGVVGFVSTSIALCGLGVAPANCSVANGNTQTGGLSATSFPFSSRTLDGLNGDPNSITVTSKQTIAVTVQFSFQ